MTTLLFLLIVLNLILLANSLATMPEFPNRLPASRLGKAYENYDSFREAVPASSVERSKEYTLIVITESSESTNEDTGRILLGKKNRGFGKGMYNSFGGKFEHPKESVEACACRELEEETNICISQEEMKNHKIGIQHFSFDEDPIEMKVHLFRINFQKGDARINNIKGCEEITPEWLEDWNQVPLDNMFADDSLWLPTLLSSSSSDCVIQINGWYHFQANCQETNTIRHYHMNINTKHLFSLEKRLFHALHDNKIHSPNIKEFKENFAFLNGVRTNFRKFKMSWDVVIDVAGGHGALAALFLITTSATKAVVIDPAQVGNHSVERAWRKFWQSSNKKLKYRNECLRTGLPTELNKALRSTTPDKVLVLACHACQHLSEEILDIACHFGVCSAVMPCCQKDLTRGSSWKNTSKNLGIRIDHVMDLLLAGKHMSRPNFEVRIKCLDPKITPQNRIIMCRPITINDISRNEYEMNRKQAHTKLETAYRRAHALSPKKHGVSVSNLIPSILSPVPLGYIALGFVMGVGASKLVHQR